MQLSIEELEREKTREEKLEILRAKWIVAKKQKDVVLMNIYERAAKYIKKEY